ncbi:MAG: hypothetical protein JWR81_1174 [Pseudonocardia sp.]|nr:hypothetical protein [Pseudonocardia sp.]MDT7615849.1 hypothetical protein [Pseudonocardiales bacterium]
MESVDVAVVRTDDRTRLKSGRSGMDRRPVDGRVLPGRSGVDGDTTCDVEHHGGPDPAVYAYSSGGLDLWAGSSVDPPHRVVRGRTSHCPEWTAAAPSSAGGQGRARGARPPHPVPVFAAFVDVPDLVSRFVAAGRPGAYLAVEREAQVRAGDPMTLLERRSHGATVGDVMAALTGDRERLPQVRLARDHMGARGRDRPERTADL